MKLDQLINIKNSKWDSSDKWGYPNKIYINLDNLDKIEYGNNKREEVISASLLIEVCLALPDNVFIIEYSGNHKEIIILKNNSVYRVDTESDVPVVKFLMEIK